MSQMLAMILQVCLKKFYKFVYIWASTMPKSAWTIVVQNGPYCLQRKLHGCELQYWTLEICVVSNSNCLKFQTGTDRWIWSVGDVFNSCNPQSWQKISFTLQFWYPYCHTFLAKWFCFGTLMNAVAFLSAFRIAGSCVNIAAVHRFYQLFLLLNIVWPSCDKRCWLMLWQHTLFNPSQSYPPLHSKSEQSSTSAPSWSHKCFPHPWIMILVVLDHGCKNHAKKMVTSSPTRRAKV